MSVKRGEVHGDVAVLAGGFIASTAGNLAGTIADAGAKVLRDGVNLFTTVAGKVIAEGAEREQDDVVFRAMLGSTDRAKALVDDVQQLAIQTPFSSRELLDQSKLLLGYGIEASKLRTTLTQLGDVVSGTGADFGRLSLAYGQVIAKGRLQASELLQFTEAGVGIADFAKAYADLTGKIVSNRAFLKLASSGRT